MGVKITDLVDKCNLKWEELQGKKVAVDASNVMFQFLSSIRQRDGVPLMDTQGNVTSHLVGLFSRVPNLMQKGIRPVFVFDGKAPVLKRATQEKRRAIKDKAQEKYMSAAAEEDDEAMGKYSRQFARVNSTMFDESKELLQALGLPIVQAPSEAEAQCAYMAKKRKVWGSASQDYDSLLFGAPRLILNMTLSQKRKITGGKYVYISPYLIELDAVLEKLELSQEQLIVLGILVGSIDGEESVFICENGLMKVVKMGVFCDNRETVSGVLVPSFDKDSRTITLNPLWQIIKHETTEPLYEVKTGLNRSVRVTASHSLFRLDKAGEIENVKTTDLQKGDLLVLPGKLPRVLKPIQEIRLSRELWACSVEEGRTILCDGVNVERIRQNRLLSLERKPHQISDRRISLTMEGIESIKRIREEKGFSRNKLNTLKVVSESALANWEFGREDPTEIVLKRYLDFLGYSYFDFINNKFFVREIKHSVLDQAIVSTKGSASLYRKEVPLSSLSVEEIAQLGDDDYLYGFKKNSVRAGTIAVSKELMRIIGYYVAEGNLNGGYRVNFSFNYEGEGHDDHCVEDLCSCIKIVFGLDAQVYNGRTGRSVCVDNIVFYSFIAHVLGFEGKVSHNKRIPVLVFNVEEKYQLDFLRAYFLGDGSLGENTFTFSTRSKDLANDLSYLLLQFGIHSSYSFKGDSGGEMNVLVVCGKERIRRLERVWDEHNQASRMKAYCNSGKSTGSHFRKDRDLMFAKVKSVVEVEPTSKWVYDFAVKGQNFVAGTGGVCCHNTDYNPGGVKGIGPKKALKLLQSGKDYTTIFSELETNFDWKEILQTFQKIPVEDVSLKFGVIDEEKVKEILVERHDFSVDRVQSTLDKLQKDASQSLQKWF